MSGGGKSKRHDPAGLLRLMHSPFVATDDVTCRQARRDQKAEEQELAQQARRDSSVRPMSRAGASHPGALAVVVTARTTRLSRCQYFLAHSPA